MTDTDTAPTPADAPERFAPGWCPPQPGSEPETCPLCGAGAPRRLLHQGGKAFWLCRSCEFVFVHDIWPEFFRGEEDLRYLDVYGEQRSVAGRRRRELERLLDELEGRRRTGRLLEVGCGVGLFLEAARARGWEVSGVELLEDVARHAREERGLDVRSVELSRAGFAEGELDVVYMNEVIEHVVDPVGLMREVRSLLRPGGLALVRTGNARSWTARLRGAGWRYYHFAGHGHIRYFSPPAARALARAAGFAGVRPSTRGFALREASELRGRWYKPLVKLAQSLVSPLARACGAGQRLSMRFER